MDTWDHKLPKSILSDYDLSCIAYGISSALYFTTGIQHCDPHHNGLCAMCGNAMRLVIQHAERKILEAALTKMAGSVGLGRIDLHPPTAVDF
jgi:hypothetical protein